MSPPPFRIVPYPPGTKNPYLDLFYGALRPGNVEKRRGGVPSLTWLARAEGVDAVHFHWPDRLWSGGRAAPRVGRFLAFLALARLRGIRLIWTVHNLTPHEGEGAASRLARRTLGRHADLLICHDDRTAEAVKRQYRPAGEVVVMPHGNYAGCYPEPQPRDEVLRRLGLRTDLPVVSCVGNIRTYKGTDIACDAVERLAGRVQLLIAGPAHPEFDAAGLASRVEEIEGAFFLDRALSDAEFADLTAASDLVLLPYRKITGSGVLHAAWTLGRAVVASDLPYFRETSAEAGAAAWLSEPNGAAFAEAIEAALAVSSDEREQAALTQADRYGWETCVRPVARVFDLWRAAESGGHRPVASDPA